MKILPAKIVTPPDWAATHLACQSPGELLTRDGMSPNPGNEQQFSAVRAICIGAVLLVVGAFWVMVQELLLSAGSLSSNAPPVGAVGLFAGLMTIVLGLQWLRARWGLGRKELLIIYCMLATFFPLASEGLWHRFVGVLLGLRTTGYYAPIPAHMTPRGPEMVTNGDFADGLTGWEGNAQLVDYRMGDTGGAALQVAGLINEEEGQTSELRQWIDRAGPDGSDRFAPGQKITLWLRLRGEALAPGTWMSAAVSTDAKRWQLMPLGLSRQTRPVTRDGTGLTDIFNQMIELPADVEDGLWLRFSLKGAGRVLFSRVQFYSNEAMFKLIEGSGEVAAADEARVLRNDKGRLSYRPEGWWSRLMYDVKGYVPWRQWAAPLASWSVLWVAMFAAMYALGSLIFRQWADREKLMFPLTAVPLMMTETGEQSLGRWSFVPRVFKSRAMWAGLGTAVLLYTLNGLNFYDSDVPGIPLLVDLSKFFTKAPWSALLGDGSGFTLRVVLLGVGVAFFMDLQMAFSLWFFYLLCKLYLLIPFYQGDLDRSLWHGGPSYGQALWQSQGIGAAVGVVLIALWLGRRHIVEIFRKSFGGGGIDDSQEPMPYRLAMCMLAVSLVLFGVWGEIAGVGWLFGLLGMGAMLMLAVMAARVRAECAAPGMWLVPATPVVFMILLGGTLTFGVRPMTYYLIVGNFMCTGFFLMMMPALMENFQIAKVAGIGRRTLGTAMVVGFVVAVVAGGYLLLNWGYARGLSTMRGSITINDDYASVLWRWRAENDPGYNSLLRRFDLQGMAETGIELSADEQKQLAKLSEKPLVHPTSWIAAAGAGITCLLAYVRLTFLRFPLHPLGYALATTQLMGYFWFSIFLAWLIRLAGLRLGGVRMIRNHLQPYMIGLILGSVAAVLLWDAVGIYKVANGYTGQIYVTW